MKNPCLEPVHNVPFHNCNLLIKSFAAQSKTDITRYYFQHFIHNIFSFFPLQKSTTVKFSHALNLTVGLVLDHLNEVSKVKRALNRPCLKISLRQTVSFSF